MTYTHIYTTEMGTKLEEERWKKRERKKEVISIGRGGELVEPVLTWPVQLVSLNSGCNLHLDSLFSLLATSLSLSLSIYMRSCIYTHELRLKNGLQLPPSNSVETPFQAHEEALHPYSIEKDAREKERESAEEVHPLLSFVNLIRYFGVASTARNSSS